MKLSRTLKSLDSAAITDEQLQKINRYTRRALSADEVFIFSVILCDNEIDRDYERFPEASLEILSELFVGKTGIFDHNPKTEGQSARIFDTALYKDGEQNSLGEAYCCVKAWAYMLRSEKNENLIREIDAGIKKEVSIGCAVEQTVCSVCGADQHADSCAHKKGNLYNGARCHHLLLNPTDAYEWSFVAVPAQKAAGVVKRANSATDYAGEVRLEKVFASGDSITISKAQLDALRREYDVLKSQAEAGRAHEQSLRGEVVRFALLSQPELDPELMRETVKNMSFSQLTAFHKAFRQSAAARYPITTQLGGMRENADADAGAEFKI